MKLKTVLITILVVCAFCLLGSHTYAQTSFEAGGGGVDINANITEDLYSQLDITPTNVEILEPATVNIQMLNVNGDPKPGRSIVLYVNGSSLGVTITQPAVSDSDGRATGTFKSSIPGTYEVCARDTTEGFNIYILDCETIYVVPVAVPTLLPEPAYTKGLSNTLSWAITSGNYTYFIQSSVSSTFAPVFKDSGWIGAESYEFTGLANSQIYFYHVKAKNNWGGESSWSNSVYSVQDNSSPEVKLLSISGLGDNTTKDWEAQDTIIFKLRVKDNIVVSQKSFWCVLQDGSTDECIDTQSVSGDIWTVKVKLGELEHNSDYDLFAKYSFCAEASDSVGNITRICNIYLNIPATGTPEKPVVPIIEQIKDVVNNIVESTNEFMQNTIGKINNTSLQQLTITITLGNILLGMGILLGGLGTLPYIILQIFLAISSLLGFRKKGHPTGYVYDSVTKEPISQCVVRIFNENSVLIWTDVTDRDGYFRTNKVVPGEYVIKTASKDYDFPSKIVFGKTDFPLENVYQGQEFYTSKGVIPNFSIPMDLKKMGEFKRIFSQLAFGSKVLWKSLHILLFLVGLVFSIYALSVNNIWYNYLVIILYIPSLVILFFSLFNRREKFGVVKDISGRRLAGITIGLKEMEFGKLVSKRVTDENGRYRFFVAKGVYEIAVLNSDWVLVDEKSVANIIVKKEDILIKGIVLKKVVQEKKVKKVKVEEVLEPLEEL